MATRISTATGTAQNITTELLLAVYTNSTGGDMDVSAQVRLSSLANTAATITLRAEHRTANDAVLAYQADITTWSKQGATNTTFGVRSLLPVMLADGEKLAVFARSTNASDTAAAYSIAWMDESATQIQSALTKIQAAVYDPNTDAGGILSLSNAKQLRITENGREHVN